VTLLLQELKTRARLRLNAGRRGDAATGEPETKLRDCLNAVSRKAGFAHWEHARMVLGGLATAGDDMGTFWYAPGCATLLNEWFASYADAAAVHATDKRALLLPYRRQFVLVGGDFVRELGLDPADRLWDLADRDLVRAYGSHAWLHLANERLQARAGDGRG